MDQAVELRCKTLNKIRGTSDHPRLKKVIFDYFTAVSKYSISNKKIELYNQKNEMVAFLLPSRFYHRFYGQLLTQYIFDYDHEFEDLAIPFLSDQIQKLMSDDGLQLIESYAPARKLTKRLDKWQIVASSYAGDPAQSNKSIQQNLHHQLRNNKLKIEEAMDEGDVERIMKIKAFCFEQNPQLCWFWNCDQYQSQEYMRLINSLGKKQTYLIRHENDHVTVGYLGMHYDYDSIYWGPSSGIDLLLAPEYQGKKLSYELYSFAFEQMLKCGIQLYRGATANKSVLSVGKKMGRWLIYDQLIPK